MRFLKSEAGALVVWLAAALFAAALLTPFLYDAGKTLAQNAETADYPAVIESIAASAKRAKPDRFFSRALLISAVVLMPILIRRVKRIPPKADAARYSLRKLTWPQRLIHLSSGLLIGTACLGGLALVLYLIGAAVPTESGFRIGRLFGKAFIPALGAGVIEELVFRGLLLGLWLRACSLWTAWIGSSLLFSFMHFLSPPSGMEIADPRAWYSGFEILSSTLGHFSNPTFFVTEFATLAVLGFILAWCRTRTFSLWLPIGIHAGLVFALKTFSLTSSLNSDSAWSPWCIGADLKTGIFPLIAITICLVISVITVRFLPGVPTEKTATPE